MSAWQPIETAPRDKPILLLMGETIPDVPDVRVGQYTSGDVSEELGYHEYAKYGGWTIWNADSDFWIAGIDEATHWASLPEHSVKP